MEKIRTSSLSYSLVLNILHQIFTCFYILYTFGIFVKSRIRSVLNNEPLITDHHEFIKNELKDLNKLPQHLALILGPEEPSFKDLINIVTWCTSAKIPYLTLYDHKGLLKKSKDKFFKELSESSGLILNNGVWTKQEEQESVCMIKINVLSLIDGNHGVIEATKKMILDGVSSKDISMEVIDKYLMEKLGNVPDPDLAIYCGDVCFTYGFLPWQSRLTEFINLKTHRNVTVEEFFSILRSYSRVERRFGK